MGSFSKTRLFADIIPRLGIGNVIYIAWYRFTIRTAIRKHFFISRRFHTGQDFFQHSTARTDCPEPWKAAILSEAEKIAAGRLQLYGHHWKAVGRPPDWFLNPFNSACFLAAIQHWTKVKDFHPKTGDIKNVWEASRFEWVVTLACAYAVSGDEQYLQILNRWLKDWTDANPVNLGPNWKCGQEVSFRVINLIQAALVLDQWDHPGTDLKEFIGHHLERIHGNIHYALAQDNNHGTSEAAALFMGGCWLARAGHPSAMHLEHAGRRWLENRVRRLISADGSFSQYSVNYHRLVVDTLCLAELWRRRMGSKEFTPVFYSRAEAAVRWLDAMVDPDSGDAPNLGANDGARLLQRSGAGYRDFRPSVQFATALFLGRRAYSSKGEWNEPLWWFGEMPRKSEVNFHKSRVFDDGGFAVLRRGSAKVVLRYPRFRFRPSHADALHLDLWVAGDNLLRDGGSFSYAAEKHWMDYFSGTASHNTVQFDGRDQMPRLGRFLFGDWLKTLELKPLSETRKDVSFGASYRDRQNCFHRRFVRLEDSKFDVQDEISGFRRKAVLRWRLMPGPWRKEGDCLSDGRHRLKVSSTVAPVRSALVQGWESRYYMQKTQLPVFEIEVREPCRLTTEYRWK